MMKETKWSIDQSHSSIIFKVRHLMISHVTGNFKTFDASIYTTDKDFSTAVVDLWIDASSVETGDETRDEHLKGVDFFDVLSHKQISFTSSTIGKADNEGNHELWGELTMKGITKNLKLDVLFGGLANDPFGNEKAGFTVTGTINRSDWGLVWNTAIETGGFVVSDEINILCEIELTRVEHKEPKIAVEPPMNEIVIL
jgi:polyisoprenoid-binding protein YceI